jgi:hypothetical protein
MSDLDHHRRELQVS